MKNIINLIKFRNLMSNQNQDAQEKAYKLGAFNYAKDDKSMPKYALVAGLITFYKKGAAKIIDLGCGYSQILSLISKYRYYHGIDLSRTAVDYCKKKYSGHKNTIWSVGDFLDEKIRPKNVNCILWLGVSAHINNFEKIIDKYSKKLENNGIFIFESVHPLEKFINTNVLYKKYRLRNINGCEINLTKLRTSRLLGLKNKNRKVEVLIKS